MESIETEQASAFGAVLISARKQVLLRQPAGQFGGYAWTFAKGGRNDGEPSEDAALRHVRQETGWNAEILAEIPGTFKGTTSTTKFYLAGRVGRPAEPDAETTATRWFSFEEAASYIRQSPNALGRERDLMILRAAEEVL